MLMTDTHAHAHARVGVTLRLQAGESPLKLVCAMRVTAATAQIQQHMVNVRRAAMIADIKLYM